MAEFPSLAPCATRHQEWEAAVLDSYIIEEIKKEDERRRRSSERPRLRIDPSDGISLPDPREDRDVEEEESDRIIRIELR